MFKLFIRRLMFENFFCIVKESIMNVKIIVIVIMFSIGIFCEGFKCCLISVK